MIFSSETIHLKKAVILILVLIIAFDIISYLSKKINNSKLEIFMFISYYGLFLGYYNQFYQIPREFDAGVNCITTQICDHIFIRNNCIFRNIINCVSYLIFFYTLSIPIIQNDYYSALSYFEQIVLTINFIVLPSTLAYLSYHDNIKHLLSYENVYIYDMENQVEKKYTRNRNGYMQV
jgi:hypothetical protein